jgi:hypothetical protein
LKLSEAIVEGAKYRPQVFGGLFQYLGHDIFGSCALGAAFEAGVRGKPLDESDLRMGGAGHEISALQDVFYFPPLGIETTGKVVAEAGGQPCSHCLSFAEETIGLVVHLNDDHKLSREAIARGLGSAGL